MNILYKHKIVSDICNLLKQFKVVQLRNEKFTRADRKRGKRIFEIQKRKHSETGDYRQNDSGL